MHAIPGAVRWGWALVLMGWTAAQPPTASPWPPPVGSCLVTVAGPTWVDGAPGEATPLLLPSQVAVAWVGGMGNRDVVVADSGSHRLVRVRMRPAPEGWATTTFTIAGTGWAGFDPASGGGGGQVAAQGTPLSEPQGVTIGANGTLWVADTSNHRVRMIDGHNGTIRTIVGSGVRGFAGDGGDATAARLSSPGHLAMSSDGATLYVADTCNNRVRAIHNGRITTFMGSGMSGCGDGGYNGDGRLRNASTLNAPTSVAVGVGGVILVSDSGNHRVRGVQPNGMVFTLAGNGNPGYSGDGGAATSARVQFPQGLAVTANGTVLVADRDNHCVRAILPSGIIITMAGSGGTAGYDGDGGAATAALLNAPSAVTVAPHPACSGVVAPLPCAWGEVVFVSDGGNRAVRWIDDRGIIRTLVARAVSGFSGGIGAQLHTTTWNNPTQLLLVASTSTSPHAAVAACGGQAGGLQAATCDCPPARPAIAANASAPWQGDGVMVVDSGNHAIRALWMTGAGGGQSGNGSVCGGWVSGMVAGVGGVFGLSSDGVPAVGGTLRSPAAIVLQTEANQLYLSDAGNQRVRMVHGNGTISTLATGVSIASMALGADGVVYMGDMVACRIRVRQPNGSEVVVAGSGMCMGTVVDGMAPLTAPLFPAAMVVRSWDGALFIADSANHRVVVLVNGSVRVVAGTGVAGSTPDGILANASRLRAPGAVALTRDGDVIIADTSNNRVRWVSSANGMIYTIVGSGEAGDGGDGHPAINATLRRPRGVAMAPDGTMWIADTDNHRIRRLLPPGRCGGLGHVSDCLRLHDMPQLSCLITNVTAPPPLYVHADGIPCTVTLPPWPGSAYAVCPLADGEAGCPPITLTWYAQGGSASTQLPEWRADNVTILLNGTGCGSVGGWGEGAAAMRYHITHLPATAVLTAVTLAHPDNASVQVPCSQSQLGQVVDRGGGEWDVVCHPPLLLEPWLSGRMAAILTFNASYSLVVPVTYACTSAHNGTARPSLRIVQSPTLPPTPTPIHITAILPARVPSAGESAPPSTSGVRSQPACNGVASALRCWVGGHLCPWCTWLNGTAVSCMAPDITALRARLVVEVCGSFNVTSDGLAPNAPLLPVATNANDTAGSRKVMDSQGEAVGHGVSDGLYVWYNPSPAFSAVSTQPPQLVMRASPSSLSVLVAGDAVGAGVVRAMVTDVAINGTACGAVTWLYNAGDGGRVLRCDNWTLPAGQADALVTPIPTGRFALPWSVRYGWQWVDIAHAIPVAMLPVVRTVVPALVDVGGCVVVLGDWLLGDDAPGAIAVTLGHGLPCHNLSDVTQNRLQCCLPPVIPPTTPGYPWLQVTVTNSRGESEIPMPLAIAVPMAAAWVARDCAGVECRVAAASLAAPRVVPPPTPQEVEGQGFLHGLMPPLAIAATGVPPIACTATVTSAACPSLAFAYGLPFLATSEDGVMMSGGGGWTPLVVGQAATTLPPPLDGTGVAVSNMSGLAVHGRCGCVCNVTVSCVDSRQRVASPPHPATVHLLKLTARWMPYPHSNDSGGGAVNVTAPVLSAGGTQLSPGGVLEPLGGVVTTTLPDAPGAPAWQHLTTAAPSHHLLALLHCMVAVWPASSRPAVTVPLRHQGVPITTATAVLHPVDAVSVAWNVTNATLPSSALLGGDYDVHAECVYGPTGEHLRLPARPLHIVRYVVAWGPLSTTDGNDASPASMAVASGETTRIPLRLAALLANTLAPPTASYPLAPCVWRVVTTSHPHMMLSGAGFAFPPWEVDGAGAGMVNASFTVVGPGGQSLVAVADCNVWGQVVTTPALHVSVVAATIDVLQAPDTPWVVSSAAQPWLLRPPLSVRVVRPATAHSGGAQGRTAVLGVTCTAMSITPGSLLVLDPADDPLPLTMGVRATEEGIVTWPLWGIQAVHPLPPAVSIRIECTLPSGDAAPPVYVDAPLLHMRLALCEPPVAFTTSQTAMPPFTLAVIVGGDASLPALQSLPPPASVVGGSAWSPDPACLVQPATPTQYALNRPQRTQSPPRVVALPPIVCTVADARTPTQAMAAGMNGTLFLQGDAVILPAATITLPADPRGPNATTAIMATFHAFTVTAAPGATHALRMGCSVGGVVIPPTIPMALHLTGCPPGSQTVDVFCQRCGMGEFSIGTVAAGDRLSLAACQQCPPVGATCTSGIVTLLAGFARPVSHMAQGQLLGADAEIHPCLNPAACLVTNATAVVTHVCAPGYVGPLCAVCDADGGYGRGRGEAVCGLCWPTVVNVVLLLLSALLVLALLAYYALRRRDGRKSPQSIVLKILLSYIQAVASLTALRAGSTRAYAEIMQWADIVTANPWAISVVDCAWRLPHAAQFFATLTSPILAAAVVCIIFLLSLVMREVRCVRGVRAYMPTLRCPHLHLAVSSWWGQRRPIATLVFVLFLAYMSIISSSLRALDCLPFTIDGVRYLRTDLRVVCSQGGHWITTIAAYVALVIIGLGFPAYLFALLATATPCQLSDPSFRGAWGFLYAGYRQSPAPRGDKVGDVVTSHPNHPRSPSPMSMTANPCTKRHASALVVGASKDGVGGLTTTSAHPPQHVVYPRIATMHRRWCNPTSLLWWESVVLLRKLLLVLFTVLIPDAGVQSAAAGLLLWTALAVQLVLAPYTELVFNVMEAWSLAAAATTATLCVMLLPHAKGWDMAGQGGGGPIPSVEGGRITGSEWGLTALLLIITFITTGVLTSAWVFLHCAAMHRQGKAFLRRQPQLIRKLRDGWEAGKAQVLMMNPFVVSLQLEEGGRGVTARMHRGRLPAPSTLSPPPAAAGTGMVTERDKAMGAAAAMPVATVATSVTPSVPKHGNRRMVCGEGGVDARAHRLDGPDCMHVGGMGSSVAPGRAAPLLLRASFGALTAGGLRSGRTPATAARAEPTTRVGIATESGVSVVNPLLAT